MADPYIRHVSLFKKSMTYAMAFMMAAYPIHFSVAQAPVQAQQGTDDAKLHIENITAALPTYDEANKQFNFSFGDQDTTIGISELFPESGDADYSSLEGLYEDNPAAMGAGFEAQTRLLEEESNTGDAYRIMLEQGQRGTPDMSNDPIFDSTAQAINNAELITEFAGCEEEGSLIETTSTTHIPDIRFCSRIDDDRDECVLTHTYSVTIGEPPAVNVCPARPVGYDNFDPVYCSGGALPCPFGRGWYFDNPTYPGTYDVLWFASVSSDLTCSECVDGSMYPNKTYCSGAGNAVLGPGWYADYDDRTGLCIDLIAPADTIWCEDVAGPGNKTVEELWEPQECLDIVQGDTCTVVSTCTDLPPGAELWIEGADLCIDIDGVEVCASDLTQPAAGINPFCYEVNVWADCLATSGFESCYTDAGGNEVCWDSADTETSTCDELENNPSCSYLGEECIDGAFVEGKCRAYDREYDCGFDHDVSDFTYDTTISCGEEIKCMGTDCSETTPEKSESFNDVYTKLEVATGIRRDANCTDPTNPASCKVFDGDAFYCHSAVSSALQDCCFEPDTASFMGYIALYRQMDKLGYIDSATDAARSSIETMGAYLDSSTATLQEMASPLTQTVESTYQSLTDPIVQTYDTIAQKSASAWNSVTQSFSSQTETLTGSAETLVDAATGEGISGSVDAGLFEGISTTMSEMYNAALESTYEFLATYIPGSENLLLSPVMDEFGENQLEDAAGNLLYEPSALLSNIMFVYTVYNITKLVLSLLWPCTEEEYELAAKRDTKACTRIGKYCGEKILGICVEKRTSFCCYSSPLTRIIQEQIHLQGVGDYGDAKDPDCSGITLAQLDLVDWDRVDLSEWIALLDLGGALPDPTSFSMETLTGNGSTLDFGEEYDRPNVQERSFKKAQDITDVYNYNTLLNDAKTGAQIAIPGT